MQDDYDKGYQDGLKGIPRPDNTSEEYEAGYAEGLAERAGGSDE